MLIQGIIDYIPQPLPYPYPNPNIGNINIYEEKKSIFYVENDGFNICIDDWIDTLVDTNHKEIPFFKDNIQLIGNLDKYSCFGDCPLDND